MGVIFLLEHVHLLHNKNFKQKLFKKRKKQYEKDKKGQGFPKHFVQTVCKTSEKHLKPLITTFNTKGRTFVHPQST